MKRLLILFIILTGVINVFAQDVKFTATAPRVVEVGENFRLTYSLNQKGKNIEIGSLAGFQLLMGPSVSNSYSTQYINGKVSKKREQSYSYVLLAEKEGKFTIQPAHIKVDGKVYASNIINIEVVKGRGNSQDKYEKSNKQGQVSSSNRITKDNLFVKVEIDKKSVYMGEFVVATLKLYSRVQVSNLGRSKFPTFQGFLSQEIKMPDQISLNRENVNGEIYSVGVLRKLVLFPQHSGKIKIDPFELDVYVRQQSGSTGSVFDDFFANYQDVKVNRKSKPIIVNVKSLPLDGQPADFNGTVGQIKMISSISRDTVLANDAVTLKVKIKGNGNLKLVEPLDIDFPADFEVYDPKTSQKIKSGVNGTYGSVIFDYVFIPRSAGKYIIPSKQFVYFDSNTRKYITLKTKEFVINVKPGKQLAQSGDVVATYSKEDVKFIGRDIRYIKTKRTHLYEKGKYLFGSSMYYLSFLLSLLVFATIIFLNKRRIRNNLDIARVKNKRASKLAKKRLRAAEKMMKAEEKETFYDEILKALWGFTSDKLNIPISDLSKDNIAEVLTQKGVEELVIKEYLEILDTCEFARYAPVMSEDELSDVYIRTSELLMKLS